jgi:phosphatidylglycerophosphatase A
MNSPAVALVLATWGGCGYSPIAPATLSSLFALLMAYGLVHGLQTAPGWLAAAAIFLCWPASWAAGVAASHFGRPDPPQVVVDEVIGQWLALAVASPDRWQDWLAALLLFRLLDIAKPFPICRLERLPGGIGVVADDVAAGLCSMMILAGLHLLSLW